MVALNCDSTRKIRENCIIHGLVPTKYLTKFRTVTTRSKVFEERSNATLFILIDLNFVHQGLGLTMTSMIQIPTQILWLMNKRLHHIYLVRIWTFLQTMNPPDVILKEIDTPQHVLHGLSHILKIRDEFSMGGGQV